MLMSAETLSALSRIVLVNSKMVFKSLSVSISYSTTVFLQGNASGKIKSSFLNFKPGDLLDLFSKQYDFR